MQMDLDFSPASMAMLRQPIDQPLFILLSGIKISVNERTAVAIPPTIRKLGVLPTPELESPLLLVVRSPSQSAFGDNTRLEVVGQSKNQMNLAFRPRSRQSLPDISGQNPKPIGRLRTDTATSRTGPDHWHDSLPSRIHM